jgi:hypothetical protein
MQNPKIKTCLFEKNGVNDIKNGQTSQSSTFSIHNYELCLKACEMICQKNVYIVRSVCKWKKSNCNGLT